MHRDHPHVRPYLALLLVAGVVMVVAFWSFASGDGQEQGPTAPVRTYTEGVVGTASHVNPLFAAGNRVDEDLAALVFSGLTSLAPDGRIRPDLVERWEVSADGREYSFFLRPGVLWHDGKPVTADDVVFTFRLLSDPNFPGDPNLGAFWRQITVEKVSDTVVRFRLPEAFAPFLAQTSIGILPRHLLEGLTAEQLSTSPFNQRPVGTGPYRLVSLSETGAVLEYNPEYHLGPPGIPRLEFRFYPDEPSALNALRAGELDGLYVQAPLGDSELAGFQEAKVVYSLITNNFVVLYLNWRSPFFTDVRVREAIASAIDRQRLVKDILAGRGVLVDSPITPGSWAYDISLQPHGYDPERARQLLEEAGWTLNGAGIREKEGTELRFTLLTNNDSARLALGTEIARMLKEVGVAADLSAQGGATLYQDFLLTHQYAAALFGFASGPDPDPYPAWHSSQVNGGSNITFFVDQRADELLEEARRASDPVRRIELYGEFQQIFSAQFPSIILFYPTTLYILPPDLQGVELGVMFSPASRFANVWQWSLAAR